MNETTDLPKTFDKNDLIDHRQEHRISMHFPSLFIKQNKEIYTTVVNLSENGIGFLSAMKADENDEILISFESVQDFANPSVNLKVRVRTCQEVDHEYYIGGSIISKPLNYTKFFKMFELGQEP
jgi:hypothetical protein